MIGALWSAASGVGFGVFQAVNRRAGFRDAYVATFMQLVVALVVLLLACAAVEDLGQLADATAWSIGAFALSGLVHFMVGSTLLNLSQARIGAARTAPMLTTTPLFGLVIAAVTLGETPRPVALAGIAVVVVGAFVLSQGEEAALHWRDAGWGLATAFAWALSPILIVEGLRDLDSPLLGVTIGMAVSVLGYAALLAVLRVPLRRGDLATGALGWQVAPGVLIAVALWWRFIALDLTSVAVVLTLTMLSVPVVLLLAPLLSGRQLEHVDLRIWTGATLVVGGAIVLILGG
jgi:drug/metabolite transporter (DMT)-like permease